MSLPGRRTAQNAGGLCAAGGNRGCVVAVVVATATAGGVPTACAEPAASNSCSTHARLVPVRRPAARERQPGRLRNRRGAARSPDAAAREQGKDRYFQLPHTRAAEQSLLGEGEFIASASHAHRAVIAMLDVYESSPAAAGGCSAATKSSPSTRQCYEPVAQLLAMQHDQRRARPPRRVCGAGCGCSGRRHPRGVLVKRTVTIDPVPDTFGVQVLRNRHSGRGYLNLRTYITTAGHPARRGIPAVPRAWPARPHRDLRYNGGGLLSTRSSSTICSAARAARPTCSSGCCTASPGAPRTPRPISARSRSPCSRYASLSSLRAPPASPARSTSHDGTVGRSGDRRRQHARQAGRTVCVRPAGLRGPAAVVTFKTVTHRPGRLLRRTRRPRAILVHRERHARPALARPRGNGSAALEWCARAVRVMSSEPGAQQDCCGRRHRSFPRPRQPSAAQWWLPGIN